MDIKGYKILLPKKTTECLSFAGKELNRFLHTCTDNMFPVTTEIIDGVKYISLGKTDLLKAAELSENYAGLGDDGFFIKVKDENVFIDGNYDRSVLYGVYDFLEEYFGVRFLAADCTFTPQSSTIIEKPVSRYEVPAFEVRAYMSPDISPSRVDQDFQARSRARSSFVKMDEKHGYRPWFFGRANSTHNFHYYVPYEKYGESHPEFYYQRAGVGTGIYKEDGTIDQSIRTICLTNGVKDDGTEDESMEISVLKVVVEELKKDILANPEVKYFSFEQEDLSYGCECEKCKKAAEKFKRSGVQIRFCNLVARKLQKWADEELGGREINIITFAYSYTKDAPVKEVDGKIVPIDETVVPADNLIIRLAIMQNDYYGYFDERQPEDVCKVFKEWPIIGKKFMFWGYDIGFDSVLMFLPSDRVIGENVRGIVKRKFIHVMFEGESPSTGGWQPLMRGYAYNKLFWNPNLDAEALLQEFRLHYFGEIGAKAVEEFMQLYYDYYDKVIKDKKIVFILFKNYKNPENLDISVLEKSIEIIEKAEKDVGIIEENSYEKQKHLERLASVKCGAIFSILEHFKYYYPQKTEADERAFAKEFLKCCKSGNVSGFHSMQNLWSLEKFEFEDDYKLPY